VSRVLHPARHIIGYFVDESFKVITCTGSDNSKQTRENKPTQAYLSEMKYAEK